MTEEKTFDETYVKQLRDEAANYRTKLKDSEKEARRLSNDLKIARARERSWRESFHALRLTLEGRLDRVADALEEWESAE